MTPKLIPTYYNDKQEHGPIYNWKLVFSEYKKLKVPAGLYDPCKTPVDKAHICDIISIRARGKTTAWLIVGMKLNQLYGCTTSYVRQNEDMLAPVNARELFGVINSYEGGRYVKECTNGEYNYVLVKDRRAYFAWINENGEIERKTTEPWLYMLSVDRNYLYKSSLNLPDCNLIIYDEFIGKDYKPNEFVQFNDLLSTIIRKRITPVVIMLANNIDVNSPYFREQEISREVKKMKLGDSKILYTTKGMSIYVELDKPNKVSRHISVLNRLFFGYSNPRLTSITGDSDAWVFDIYPHIEHEKDETIISRNLYIDTGEDLINIEFVQQPTLGIVCHIHPATVTYPDSIILTMKDYTDVRYQFARGTSKQAVALWRMYAVNRCFFADNETGSLFSQYVDMCKISKK